MFQDEGDRKPGSVPPQFQAAMIIHLGQALPTASSDRTQRLQASNLYPTSSHRASAAGSKMGTASLFGLAPSGGLPSPGVTIETGALLPHRFTLTKHGARWSSVLVHGLWRFVFCGTFLRVAPTGSYPAPCSAEPGLSSLHLTVEERSSGLLRPENWRWNTQRAFVFRYWKRGDQAWD